MAQCQLSDSFFHLISTNFSEFLTLSLVGIHFWSVDGAAVVEVTAALLKVKLLVPISDMEQADSEVA